MQILRIRSVSQIVTKKHKLHVTISSSVPKMANWSSDLWTNGRPLEEIVFNNEDLKSGLFRVDVTYTNNTDTLKDDSLCQRCHFLLGVLSVRPLDGVLGSRAQPSDEGPRDPSREPARPSIWVVHSSYALICTRAPFICPLRLRLRNLPCYVRRCKYMPSNQLPVAVHLAK